MSRRPPNRLTARKLATLPDGVHGDGGNLWITIRGETRAWTFRYTSPASRKRREMGLGPARDISLADARQIAADARRLLLSGIDPIDDRENRRNRSSDRTFEQVAETYITEQAPGWRDPRAVPIWHSSLSRHVYPAIGSRPIQSLGTDDMLSVLRPLWSSTTETASRLRGRVERIIDYARSQGWYAGENPARWRGHLASILPRPSAVAPVRNFPAVPYRDLPGVMQRLAGQGGIAAVAVRFVCLTASRSDMVRSMTWKEVDIDRGLWVIPATRMKSRRDHRVPLSEQALSILEELKLFGVQSDRFVFPGGREGRPLSDVALSKALHAAAGSYNVTVHGLRSGFRDWVAEETDFPGDVAEMALAHVIRDKVEAAYRRGDLFDKRREMMQAWSVFLLRTT